MTTTQITTDAQHRRVRPADASDGLPVLHDGGATQLSSDDGTPVRRLWEDERILGLVWRDLQALTDPDAPDQRHGFRMHEG